MLNLILMSIAMCRSSKCFKIMAENKMAVQSPAFTARRDAS